MTEAAVITITPAEIQANRERYIEALFTSTDQCKGHLFKEVPGGQKRCAVGVAATVLFNIQNVAELELWRVANPDLDIYDEIARKLGMPTDPDLRKEFNIDTLWLWNDAAPSMSFCTIAKRLKAKWELA